MARVASGLPGSSRELMIECIWPVQAQLGEGPVWVAREQCLWFVDIKAKCIHRASTDGSTQSWIAPREIGFILPMAGGGYLCGLQSGLHRFDPRQSTFSLLARVESDRPRNRLNDAHVDASGRLWFGTMDNDEREPTGSLYCIDQRGLKCADSGYVITNGPATSPDGRALYHVDTLQRLIYAFDLHDDGTLHRRRVFARIDESGAYPDGLAVDSAGYVWVALFGGWGVQRISPQGRLLEKLRLPVANCTNVTFGGNDLLTLYITTAWKGLTAMQRAEQPLAGSLFRARMTTPGLPQREVNHVL